MLKPLKTMSKVTKTMYKIAISVETDQKKSTKVYSI